MAEKTHIVRDWRSDRSGIGRVRSEVDKEAEKLECERNSRDCGPTYSLVEDERLRYRPACTHIDSSSPSTSGPSVRTKLSRKKGGPYFPVSAQAV